MIVNKSINSLPFLRREGLFPPTMQGTTSKSYRKISKYRGWGSINNLAPTTTFKWLHAGPGELRSDNVFV